MNDPASQTVTACHGLNLSHSLWDDQLVSSTHQLPGDKLSLGNESLEIAG